MGSRTALVALLFGHHGRRVIALLILYVFFFSSRRRHTRFDCDWSSDVCSSDLSNNLKVGGWGWSGCSTLQLLCHWPAVRAPSSPAAQGRDRPAYSSSCGSKLKSPQSTACGVCGLVCWGEPSLAGWGGASAWPSASICRERSASAWAMRWRREKYSRWVLITRTGPSAASITVAAVQQRGMLRTPPSCGYGRRWWASCSTGRRVATRLPKRCRPTAVNSSTAAPKKTFQPSGRAARTRSEEHTSELQS